MKNLFFAGIFAIVVSGCVSDPGETGPVVPAETIRLFNGRNLENWYVWIAGKGRDNDPAKVFKVEDGLLKISGREYGCITTDKEYRDYRLVFEYRFTGWIDEERKAKKQAPDSGILFHSTGPDGGFYGIWMASHEYNVIEGGTGDFWTVATKDRPDIQLTAKVEKELNDGKIRGRYAPDGKQTVTIGGNYRILRGEAVELEYPAWNVCEVVCDGDKVVAKLNGVVVNEAVKVTPSFGRIQIQSEGSEVEVRRIEISPVRATESEKNQWGAASIGEWEKSKRPETLKWFLENEYGLRPQSLGNAKVSYETIDSRVLDGGKVLKRKILVKYAGTRDSGSFAVTLYQPRCEKPLPLAVLLCNRRHVMDGIGDDDIPSGGFWPVKEILERGFATASYVVMDLAPETHDYKTAFLSGVFPCFESSGERTDTSWGTLSAWGWGASLFMDWVLQQKDFDPSRVGIVGHSRGGKAALVAGALDSRFSLVCSNNSGCGGAKLNRVEAHGSECYSNFTPNRYGYWFCGRMRKVFPGRELSIEHDQDEWLAMIAPRKLCIGSATADAWAGPVNEYLASERAKRIWKLYGCEDRVRHHFRKGKHNLTPYDWMHYLDAL